MSKQDQNKKPAATYLRRSTDKQEQSLELQRKTALEYANTNDWIIVKTYVDDAVSGTSTKGRKGFLQMIEDAQREDCPFRAILVYDASRFSRSDPLEASHYLYLLKQSGIKVIYIKDRLPGNDLDYVMIPFLHLNSHQDSKNTSYKTIDGHLARAKEGFWNGGIVPFGFDAQHVDQEGKPHTTVRYMETGERQIFNENGTLQRVVKRGEKLPKVETDRVRLVLGAPERVAFVRRIFDMYVKDKLGFKTIAETFNEERIPSPRNGNYSKTARAGWGCSTIKGLIQNPVYAGDLAYNRRSQSKYHRVLGGNVVERDGGPAANQRWNEEKDHVLTTNMVPAIIDRETFEKAQQLCEKRKQNQSNDSFRTGRGRKSPYLLSGLIHCDHCGHKFSGQRIQKGKARKDGSKVKTYYYICGGYLAKGNSICMKAPLPRDEMEAAILERVRSQVIRFMEDGGKDLLRKVLKKGLNQKNHKPKDDIKTLKERITHIGQDINRLMDSLTPINKEFVDEKLIQLKNEKAEIEARIEELKARPEKKLNINQLVEEIINCISRFDEVFSAGTIGERKEFINLFIEKIVLNPKKKKALLYIRKFPTPASMVAGNLSIEKVAGAHCVHQKTLFPPLDVVELHLANRRTVLIPQAA